MARRDTYALLLLAGGKSSRMGRNKAELIYQGKTFLEQMLSKAKTLGIEQIYISGYPEKREDVRVVWDVYPQRGPLGGLHACMKVMTTPYCLVLPVDAPQLPVSVLEGLLRCHEDNEEKDTVLIWEHCGRQEPLMGVYPAAMAESIEALIREGSAPVFRALEQWGYQCVSMDVPEEDAMNINTPAAYEKLLCHERGGHIMEKETIHLRRVSFGEVSEVEDVVALEHHFSIPLKSGEVVSVACTPSFVEELTLGRRYLLGDLDAEECGQTVGEGLSQLPLTDVFSISRAFFENPGDLFQTTGCAHSCALFHRGKILCVMEDIGRHNALDKVIGYAIKHEIPLGECMPFTSGRISEDYLGKVIRAGFGGVVSRAAVTEAAVALARRENITMLGFVRRQSANIYHEGRIKLI